MNHVNDYKVNRHSKVEAVLCPGQRTYIRDFNACTVDFYYFYYALQKHNYSVK
jgi:hypothetical protein